MKRLFTLYLTTFLTCASFGQIPDKVKKVFLNLPLDGSRTDIHAILKSDKRFTSIPVDTSGVFGDLYKSKKFYLAWCKDQGIVKQKADSIEVEIMPGLNTFGKDFSSKVYITNHLTIRYFFSSEKKVKKAYKKVVDKVKPFFTVSAYTFVDTLYPGLRRQFTAKGVVYKNVEQKYNVRIFAADLTKNHFGLIIEFEKPDE